MRAVTVRDPIREDGGCMARPLCANPLLSGRPTPAQPEPVEGHAPTSAKDAEAGMEEMSKVFKEKGGEVYLPADPAE